VIGAALGALLIDRIGRRKMVYSAALAISVGAALLGAAGGSIPS
jgi:hypothetical protein